MTSISFDPIHSALLSMDLQTGVVSVYATNDEGFVTRAATVLEHGRRAGMTVIHVKVGFRPGVPEIHSRNMLLRAIKTSPQHQQFFAGNSGAIHAALTPLENDLVVTKSRVNAFVGTDLDLLLRAREIDTLVMFGIATSGVVLSTALHAAYADYRLFIVKDCCADLDESVHSCVIDKILPRFATVLSSEEFLRTIGKGGNNS
ncbi:MAG TPA: isochorismatase family cysteine hydrolase [Pyrinomonadaceae bacterium]|nr:isochorismatase family cysteine hydrolase [Pyrinomonadaceae bacterium]